MTTAFDFRLRWQIGDHRAQLAVGANAADAIEQRYVTADDLHERVADQSAPTMAAPNANGWDTRSRREEAAQSLSDAAAQEGVAADVASEATEATKATEATEARMLADVSQAEPSQSAVSGLAHAGSPGRGMNQRAQERRPQRSR